MVTEERPAEALAQGSRSREVAWLLFRGAVVAPLGSGIVALAVALAWQVQTFQASGGTGWSPGQWSGLLIFTGAATATALVFSVLCAWPLLHFVPFLRRSAWRTTALGTWVGALWPIGMACYALFRGEVGVLSRPGSESARVFALFMLCGASGGLAGWLGGIRRARHLELDRTAA